jgi:hypothetical protein
MMQLVMYDDNVRDDYINDDDDHSFKFNSTIITSSI